MDDKQKAIQGFKELSIKGKIMHLWYYYKWFIIFGLAVFLFFLVCLVQCSTRDDPDAALVYVGPGSVSSHYYGYINQSFTEIMSEDYNGNGKKTADFFEITLSADEAAQQSEMITQSLQNQPTSEQRLYIEMTTGKSVIYLVSPEFYPYIRDILEDSDDDNGNSFLVPLESAIGYVPESSVDEYGVKLSELDCYKYTDLRYFPSDAILCIRRQRKGAFAGNDSDDYYQANMNFFRDLIEWKKMEETEDE